MTRQSFDIIPKKIIIDEVQKGTPYKEIGRKFNLKDSSNICRILKNKEAILSSYESHVSPFKKSLKKTKLEYIDRGLTNFISKCNQQGVHVNTDILRQKAKEIANENGDVNFQPSNGYLTNFKVRKRIIFETIHSESGSVDSQVIVNWNTKLKELLFNIDPKDVYNGDELGLFWRLMPNKTFTVKDSVCKYGKQSKERVTVFVCANMIGDKLPLIVIGKSENPSNFNEIQKLRLNYYSNSSAWMKV
ncbi:unnamed protein product, partial [Brachionus calyciflorus]